MNVNKAASRGADTSSWKLDSSGKVCDVWHIWSERCTQIDSNREGDTSWLTIFSFGFLWRLGWRAELLGSGLGSDRLCTAIAVLDTRQIRVRSHGWL